MIMELYARLFSQHSVIEWQLGSIKSRNTSALLERQGTL